MFSVSRCQTHNFKVCNFFTDKRVVEFAIGLMNWNLRNLDHFAPEIVQTYETEPFIY